MQCKTDGCRKYTQLNENGYCTTCQPPAEVSESDQEKCGICDEQIDEDEFGIIGLMPVPGGFILSVLVLMNC